jgi:hypothetical protein
MGIITFKMKDILPLVAEISAATEFSPTIEDLFTPSLYPNDVVVDEKGLPEADPNFSWPDQNKLDKTKLQGKLQLVKDHGIYLTTNAKLPGTPSERGTLAYALGCNPNVNEDFDYEAERLFGGDDGSVSIPVSWFTILREQNKRVFKVKLTPNSVSLV